MSNYISTAISPDRVSAITGYEVAKNLTAVQAGFLPQSIAILAPKETAFEASTVTKLSFTSASEVAAEFGYKSGAYAAARILRPTLGGDVLGGIRTVVYPVDAPAGGTATVTDITVTGTATKTTTHTLVVAGRTILDGNSYSFVVEKDDTPTVIAGKMRDAANAVLGCPVTGTAAAEVATFTSGWTGTSSKDVTVTVDFGDDAAGVTYAAVVTDGAGAASVGDALALFENDWNTLVVNCFGDDKDILDALESFNGNPNDKNGRYEPSLFKPIVALFGDNSLTTLSGITAVTDSRKNECTNIHCPAPNSLGMSLEAAANMAVLHAPLAQNTPHKDPLGLLYPDMPSDVNTSIGDYSDPSKRDQIVKVGGSTVILNAGKYEVVDFVTTYHPDNEQQASMLFRWVRDIVGLDWNYKYVYTFLENIYVKGKTIVGDDTTSLVVTNTISPIRWKAILTKKFTPTLEANALLQSADETNKTITVQQGSPNKNRLDTVYNCERTGVARVLSTTNQTS